MISLSYKATIRLLAQAWGLMPWRDMSSQALPSGCMNHACLCEFFITLLQDRKTKHKRKKTSH